MNLTTKVPKNLQSFLRVDDYKTELNGLISVELIEMDCPDCTSLNITKENQVLSNQVLGLFLHEKGPISASSDTSTKIGTNAHWMMGNNI